MTLLARVSPAKRQREVSRVGIPTKKARRDLNASDAVFLPFSDGENHLLIGSIVQSYKSDSEKRPGRSGRSLCRLLIVLVGWVAQVDKNYHIRRELFRPPTSLAGPAPQILDWGAACPEKGPLVEGAIFEVSLLFIM